MPEKVRAKFVVDSVSKTRFGSNAIKLSPVHPQYDETGKKIDSENTRFYSYTPGGSIDLQVVSDETAAMFEVGKEYYVDFTPAE